MTTVKKYRPWLPGAWSKTLPPEYFTEMQALVEDATKGWFTEKDVDEGYADYIKARYIFGRMEICQTRIIPWLTSAAPHLGDVLEIGCGNGSATVPLAAVSSHVYAFDIAADQTPVAQKRCDILGVKNVSISCRSPDWIEQYVADPSLISPPVDTVVCYALFEHLLPVERIKLLIGAWRHLKPGGRLVIVETPNRLYYFDWHSSQIPFQDQLPVEIAFLWNEFSGRMSIPSNIKASSLEQLARCSVERLYRFGRGASFHEFYAALGPENFRVINDKILDRSEFPHWNAESIEMLAKQLTHVWPEPHLAFAQPCLDLVIEKTGESRMRHPSQ